MAKKVLLPKKGELVALLKFLKTTIGDDYRAEGWEEDKTPSMTVTVGCNTSTGDWSYQTGDNSFTGGAYHYPTWAVVTLTRRSNSNDLAADILDQLEDS